MKFSNFFALGVVICALAGCSKPEATLSEIKNKDLGVVNLSYGVATKEDLGNGFSCILTANPLNSTSCEIIVKVEKSGKLIDTRRIIPAALDKSADLTFENGNVTFTPHVQ